MYVRKLHLHTIHRGQAYMLVHVTDGSIFEFTAVAGHENTVVF